MNYQEQIKARYKWLLESMEGGDGEPMHFDDGLQLGIRLQRTYPQVAQVLADDYALSQVGDSGGQWMARILEERNWLAGGKAPDNWPASAKKL